MTDIKFFYCDKATFLNIIFILFFLIDSNSQSITPINDNEFNDSSFESLIYLKKELDDVKIIGLGEALHNMGGTYSAKVKMVKFLHQQCGFDVIAFESPLYNLSKINAQIKEHTATVDTLKKRISGVWSTKELEELFEYILQTSHTEKPLEYTGFDESFFKSSESQNLIKDYSNFIEILNSKIKNKIKVDSTFYNAINEVSEKSYSFSKRSPEDTLLMNKTFKKVNESLKNIDYSNDSYLYFWKLITDNLQSVYRKNYKKGHRELRMAENVNYLAQKKYPNKKIMLWAATYHLLKDLNTIDFHKEDKKKMMGAYINEMYGDKYYVMAFSPFQGQAGFKGYLGIGKIKVRSKKGSLEYYINKKLNKNFAYVSLKNEKVKNEIYSNDLNISNLIWSKGSKYNGELMDIPKTVDGIFYLKNEHLVNFNKND